MQYSFSMTKKTGIAGKGTDQPSEDFLDSMSIAQVADALGCNTATVRNMIFKGGLKAYRVGTTGRMIRILKSDFDALWNPIAMYDSTGIRYQSPRKIWGIVDLG